MMKRILIEKEKRCLTVFDAEGQRLLHCRIALGKAPVGRKKCEGDGKTPEGSFYVCTKNPNSKFHLALGVSYPDENAAQEALEKGRITSQQFDSIVSAQRNKKRPPWDTPLGGFIMIHGEHPDDKTGDWTAGCVAVTNTEMEILFAAAQLGDEIDILP